MPVLADRCNRRPSRLRYMPRRPPPRPPWPSCPRGTAPRRRRAQSSCTSSCGRWPSARAGTPRRSSACDSGHTCGTSPLASSSRDRSSRGSEKVPRRRHGRGADRPRGPRGATAAGGLDRARNPDLADRKARRPSPPRPRHMRRCVPRPRGGPAAPPRRARHPRGGSAARSSN